MNDPDFNRRLRETFQAEAAEHLRALAQDAFALEQTADKAEHHAAIERIFRATHTLKGAARMVGEDEAEALCHALEQQLSGLKQDGAAIAAATIADLQRQIDAVGQALGVSTAASIVPAEPTPTTNVPEAGAAARPVAVGQVRVPGARLDALLVRAEELVAAKLSGDQHAANLREVAQRTATWKKDWERVRGDVAALRRFVDDDAPCPIAKELRSLVHYLDAQHEFTRMWARELQDVAGKLANDQRRLGGMIGQLLDETKEVLVQPFASLLEVFPAFVRETAARQGKEVEINIQGASTEVDRRVLEELRDALIHLVRNAVDHGIETPAERRAHGKAPAGQISISVQEKSGSNVEIRVADDGRGIDPTELVAHGRRLGLIKDDAELSAHEALELVFISGFSTKAAATDLSGRGLGLAIVREKAERIGGSVEIESAPHVGTTFRFLLPMTLARFRGVFVEARQQAFVVPSPYVQRVLRLRGAQIKRMKNQSVIEVDGSNVLLLHLAEFLGLGAAELKGAGESDAFFVLLLQSARTRVALRVEGAPLEQEVVMKSLGRMLRGARNYVGATIVGNGEIVPVLNVGALLSGGARRSVRSAAGAVAAAKRTAQRRRSILVAEDSITSRSLLKNILQTAGFEVRTAVDGADAWTTLKYEKVDLVISDVQMPRLDGFELTARIRGDKTLSTLPVILITSLASREDKARGVDAGANAYIVKSSFDQSDLLEAIGRLVP